MNPNKPTNTTSTDSSKERVARTETNAQRTVRIWYQDGKLQCPRSDHHKMVKDVKNPGSKYKVPQVLNHLTILEMMEPLKTAKCSCELAAVKEASTWARPGTWENEWVQPGLKFKGLPGYDTKKVPRRVLPLQFHLKPKELAHLHEQHPGWVFVTIGPGTHDHPVAHASTMIATWNLYNSLPRGRYLDVHGNPKACQNANRLDNGKQFTAVVNIESSKDVVRRATKWGPEKNKDGKANYYIGGMRDLSSNPELNLDEYDALTSTHTLYYYDKAEIVRSIAATKTGVMHAIIHRHKGEAGEMHLGEQTWVKRNSASGNREVVQTNVRTGETYVHPDTEHWFEHTAWTTELEMPVRRPDATVEELVAWKQAVADSEEDVWPGTAPPHPDDGKDEQYERDCLRYMSDEKNSLAWTINMVGAETYYLTIVACTSKEARLGLGDTTVAALAALMDNNPVHINTRESVKRTGKVTISAITGDEDIPIPPQFANLFEELRLRMIGKVRDIAKYEAHTTYCAMKFKSVCQTDTYTVDAQVCEDLAYASFYADLPRCKRRTALLGSDLRKHILDAAVIAMTAKSATAALAPILQGIRHRL